MIKLDPFLSNLEKSGKKSVMSFNQKPKMNLPTNTQICLEMHCGGDPFQKEVSDKEPYTVGDLLAFMNRAALYS